MSLDDIRGLFEQGDFASAIQLTKELSNEKDILECRILEINALKIQGTYQQALLIVEELLKDPILLQDYNLHLQVIASKISLIIRLGKFEEVDKLIVAGNSLVTSIKNDIRNRSSSKVLAEFLHSTGVFLARSGKIDPALEKFNEALEIRQTLDLKKDVAYTLQNIAILYKDQGNYEKALDLLDNAMPILVEIEDNRGIASINNNKGNLYIRLGETNLAIKAYKDSLEIEKDIGNPQAIAGVLSNLGRAYSQSGNLQEALNAYFESLELCAMYENKFDSGDVNFNIAVTLTKLGNLDKAIKYYLESLTIYEKLKNDAKVSHVKYFLGNYYRMKGDLNAAEDCLQSSLVLRNKIGNPHEIGETTLSLGLIKEARGEIQNALELTSNALSIFTQIGNDIDRSSALYHTFRLHEKLDHSIQSNQYLEELKNINSKHTNRYVVNYFDFTYALDQMRQQTFKGYTTAFAHFKKIIDRDIIDSEIFISSYLSMIEIKLIENELMLANLDSEISKLIANLITFARQSVRIDVLIKIIIVNAKFATLQNRCEEAMLNLQEAMQLAEIHEFQNLIDEIECLFAEINIEVEMKQNKLSVSNLTLNKGLPTLTLTNYLKSIKKDFTENIERRNAISDLSEYNMIFHPIRFNLIQLLYQNYKIPRSSLMENLNITSGSLERHISYLKTANLIDSEYDFIDGKPRKMIMLTSKGIKYLHEFKNEISKFVN